MSVDAHVSQVATAHNQPFVTVHDLCSALSRKDTKKDWRTCKLEVIVLWGDVNAVKLFVRPTLVMAP